MILRSKRAPTQKSPQRGAEHLPEKHEPHRPAHDAAPQPDRAPEKRVNIDVNLQLTGNIQRSILAVGTVIVMLLTALGFHGG